MTLAASREDQRQFWVLIRAGRSISEASSCLGMSASTGLRWFHKAGGMPPLSLVQPARSRALTITDREQILVGLSGDLSIRKIAVSIGRPASTVLRELRLNMLQQYRTRRKLRGPSRGRHRVHAWDYSPDKAQRRADANLARPQLRKLAKNQRLCQQVQDRLKEEHSPEQIAARLRVDFPRSGDVCVTRDDLPLAVCAGPWWTAT
jgi:IS30 family transposase